jgi:hypothetical protein
MKGAQQVRKRGNKCGRIDVPDAETYIPLEEDVTHLSSLRLSQLTMDGKSRTRCNKERFDRKIDLTTIDNFL